MHTLFISCLHYQHKIGNIVESLCIVISSKMPETECTKLNTLVLGGFFLMTVEKARSTT